MLRNHSLVEKIRVQIQINPEDSSNLDVSANIYLKLKIGYEFVWLSGNILYGFIMYTVHCLYINRCTPFILHFL